MKIVIKEKVIPYILISLFSFIGLSAYGYKAEGQGGSKSGRLVDIQKLIRCKRMYNVTMSGILIYKTIEYLKKIVSVKKTVDEIIRK